MTREAATAEPATICALCGQDHDPQVLLDLGGYPLCRGCLEGASREIGPPKRRIYKITSGKQVAGVCGGLADYSNMDRDTFRVLVIVVAAMTAFIPVLIAYVVFAFILPTEP